MFPYGTYAQSHTSNIDNNKLSVDFVENRQFWVDSFNQLKVYQDISLQKFQSVIDLELQNPEHAYWVKFDVNNQQDIPAQYWLHIGVFDSLTLIQQKNEQFEINHRGLMVDYPSSQKQQFTKLLQNKYGFDILVPPKSKKTFFLRIKNIYRFESTLQNIQLVEKPQQISRSGYQMIFFSIFSTLFFGILFFLTAFSLTRYLQSKGVSYLYYAIYLVATISYFWWKLEKSNGFFDCLFTLSPTYYYYFELPLTVFIYISYILFASHFLNAKQELPTFHKILNISIPFLLLYFCIGLLMIPIWGINIAWEWVYWIRILLIPGGVMAIYLVFKAKHSLGLYILTGTLFMLLGAAITTYFSKALENHFIGPWDLPLLPIQIGMLVETLFFAAGLHYKSRQAEQEKNNTLMELKEQQKEMEFAKKKREEMNRLYADISHESRTPITVILAELKQITGHHKEREIIRRNGQKLLKLINSVLDINKVFANKMEVNNRQGDMMQYIRYYVQSFEALALERSQTLSVSCEPQQLLMDFDQEKFQKIMSNLIMNAVKFTPQKGQIDVKAYECKQEEINHLMIEISDTGNGIPLEFQASIFEPYVQLPNTEGGSGLGLALVKELTILMGGKIQLQSEIGKGSCFKLTFPIHRNALLINGQFTPFIEPSLLSKVENFTSPIPLSDKHPNVLVVEDNDDILNYLNELLGTHYNLFTAKNGEMGFEIAKDIRPHLIISDVMMPVMNGYELCEKLKCTPLTQHIPVILLTAKASQQDRLNGLRVYADAYLTKPFDEEELLLRIQQLLNKQKHSSTFSSNGFSQNGKNHQEESEAVQFMKELHQALEKNLQDKRLKLKQLSEYLGTNTTSLNGKIKKITGQTPAQYIRNYRLNYAKELLRSTDLTVAEVSHKIGIEPSNFNNMFKKALGKSPKQWREGKRKVLS